MSLITFKQNIETVWGQPSGSVVKHSLGKPEAPVGIPHIRTSDTALKKQANNNNNKEHRTE